MDCSRYLSFGKVYSFDEHGKPLGATVYDGLYEKETGKRHKADDFFGRVMEAFLILHRNHEIRFVPEGVDELLETPSRPVEAMDPSTLVGGQATIDLDPEAELQAWAGRLISNRR